MKVVLDLKEISDAVECYLARQGMDTDSFDLDVKILVSRSSEDNKIEVEMNKKIIQEEVPSEPQIRDDEPFKAPFSSQD